MAELLSSLSSMLYTHHLAQHIHDRGSTRQNSSCYIVVPQRNLNAYEIFCYISMTFVTLAKISSHFWHESLNWRLTVIESGWSIDLTLAQTKDYLVLRPFPFPRAQARYIRAIYTMISITHVPHGNVSRLRNSD